MERPDHLPLVTVSVLEGGPDETVSNQHLFSIIVVFLFRDFFPKGQKHMFWSNDNNFGVPTSDDQFSAEFAEIC